MSDVTALQAETSAPSVPPVSRGVRIGTLLLENGMYLVLVGLGVVATVAYHGFLTIDNLKLLLTQNAPLGVAAVGMTVVLIGGGFDLSVGSIFALAEVLSAKFATEHSVAFGLVAGLVAGLVCGVLNGAVVTRLKVNPFVATLGSSTFISGATLLYSKAQSYSVSDPGFGVLGNGTIAGIPISIIVLVAVFFVAHTLLSFSVAGRKLYAVGGNREASRLSGLRVDLVQGSTYVVSGGLAALAGVMSASQLGVGQGSDGATLALQAIAVVVIGGTSLAGGEGSVLRTVMGLLILAVLSNIFFSLAVDTNWQLITQGVIVVGAVAMDQRLRRWRAA